MLTATPPSRNDFSIRTETKSLSLPWNLCLFLLRFGLEVYDIFVLIDENMILIQFSRFLTWRFWVGRDGSRWRFGCLPVPSFNTINLCRVESDL